MNGTPSFTSNGTSSYFTFNASNGFYFARPVEDDMTWGAWLKTSQTGGGSGQFYTAIQIFGAEMGGGVADFSVVMGDGKLGFGNGPSDYTEYSNGIINDNVWHYITVTRSKSSGQVKLYIDGAIDKTFANFSGPVRSEPVSIISSTSNPTRINPLEISSAVTDAGISTNSRIQDKGARIYRPTPN
jgi:hypothetical protein